MKVFKNTFVTIIYSSLSTIFFLFCSLNILMAQIPKGVPHPDDNEPIMINSVADVILYIVLPVGLVILYFLWRRRENRRKKEEEKENEKE